MSLKEFSIKRVSTSLGRLEENWVIKEGVDLKGNSIGIENRGGSLKICGKRLDFETTASFFIENVIEQKVDAPLCSFFLQRRFELVSGEGTLSSFTKEGKRIEEAFQTKEGGKKIQLGNKVLQNRGIVIALLPHPSKKICYAAVKLESRIKLININELEL